MKKLQNEKLELKKITIIELNKNQMIKVIAGTNESDREVFSGKPTTLLCTTISQ